MFKNNPQLSQTMLAALKGALDGGFIYIFSGPEPANANDALEMASTHTQLAMLSLNSDDVTGLTLSVPSGAAISKPAGDDWRGLVSFDGAEASTSTLEPTFFRFCAAGDTGRAAGTAPRLQGSVGGPDSAADAKLATSTLTDDGTSTTWVGIFNYRLGSVG